ncbi:MAG: helix-turn-helix transcriptional regulator [Ktedonobacteraceae bacterium]|nr:helix-turn-helix transcriptional regulator [Ktedonobacteraceae bacterium]
MNYSKFRRLLGYRIGALRKKKNITQEKLAELVGKTTEHISFLERGERSPSFELLIDLSYALDAPLSYLLDITSTEPKSRIAIPAPIPLNSLPEPVEEPVKPQEQRKTDLERMKEAFEKVKELNNPKIPLWYVQTGGVCVYRNPKKPEIPLESEPRTRIKARSEAAKYNQPGLLNLE